MAVKVRILPILGGVAALLGIVATVAAIQKKEKAQPLSDDIAYPPNEISGSNLSARQAMRRANQLYSAMKGAGTNEETVYKTQLDANGDGLKLIYNKFGIREGENLGQWFLDDLGYKELLIVRAIWKKKGVTPPF